MGFYSNKAFKMRTKTLKVILTWLVLIQSVQPLLHDGDEQPAITTLITTATTAAIATTATTTTPTLHPLADVGLTPTFWIFIISAFVVVIAMFCLFSSFRSDRRFSEIIVDDEMPLIDSIIGDFDDGTAAGQAVTSVSSVYASQLELVVFEKKP